MSSKSDLQLKQTKITHILRITFIMFSGSHYKERIGNEEMFCPTVGTI